MNSRSLPTPEKLFGPPENLNLNSTLIAYLRVVERAGRWMIPFSSLVMEHLPEHERLPMLAYIPPVMPDHPIEETDAIYAVMKVVKDHLQEASALDLITVGFGEKETYVTATHTLIDSTPWRRNANFS